MSAPTLQFEAPPLRIDDLCRRIRAYLTPDQIKDVRRAYRFGADAHEGQTRKSGEPYIQHPLAVAGILADMHMDHETLIAAMLHDVIEDSLVPKEEIAEQFGGEVADIVDGLSKLTQIEFESHAEAQAQNFQKMLMAMADDIRVILVKLADRLHNMRTLGALRPDKRRRIARETLDIYAPIAQRLGMNAIRLELEELGFQALYPQRHDVLKRFIQKIRGNRSEVVTKIKNRIKRHLRQEELVAHVVGREKHLYSIYRKMRQKHLHLTEVHDVYAFRIIVDSVDTCYRTLGVIHGLYKPVPGTFKDYIAIPKANGYQSLHTVLFGPFGVPLEVQIRTNEMDHVAEAGIAAHWLYKTGDSAAKSAHKRAREWLRGVIELQRRAGNSQEFLENVKVDLFPDEVYVFTPKGAIMEMPRGATAIDMAYAIHTDIGNKCVGCRINRRLVPLRTRLKTGDTVEIVTAPGARPNPAWLNFVVTGKARANIRHFLKNLHEDEASVLGKRMLNRELENFASSIDALDPARVRAALASFNLKSMEELLANIGLGVRPAPLVARALVSTVAEDKLERPARRGAPGDSPGPLLIHGTEGMVVSIPKCCYPIPGDPIMGFITAGRGIVIHHPSCKNVIDFRSAPDRWVDVEWAPDLDREFSVEIVIDVVNQRGVLATIAAGCADQNANIEAIEIVERDEHSSTMRLTIGVHHRKHLADVIRVLRNIDTVARVHRKRA
ncbi:MAG: bifunctional (p)ppGpp synthetase/guanosine-3',5'-bis(diphosphate) 3'-pyrophosphohydrolase [Proteobacteria bacterium]|jgi:guanosine-3',5'-bis(diphosphate) 3'-pyrophosphohydrolase|nr:bifunctional (p)ppGpp synthetase/guanosine-3',5'-bis(diphosphate) 3'-pyrophosphohydrolase [Pseudomonadota bacterium]